MIKKKTASIRKGIAAVIFRRRGGALEFLVMHRILRWKGWESLKGGINPGEDGDAALIREINEELDIERNDLRILGIIPDTEIKLKIPLRFRAQMGGFMSALYKPFYLVEMSQGAKPDLRKDDVREHDDIQFVPYEKGLKMLTYPNTRAALRKAMKILSHK